MYCMICNDDSRKICRETYLPTGRHTEREEGTACQNHWKTMKGTAIGQGCSTVDARWVQERVTIGTGRSFRRETGEQVRHDTECWVQLGLAV